MDGKDLLKRATDYSGSGKRKAAKGILGIIIIILLGALGLEVSNNDFDLGALLSGKSFKEAKMQRDSRGNLTGQTLGNACGDEAKDIYNCEDFKTQEEAQAKWKNVWRWGAMSTDWTVTKTELRVKISRT